MYISTKTKLLFGVVAFVFAITSFATLFQGHSAYTTLPQAKEQKRQADDDLPIVVYGAESLTIKRATKHSRGEAGVKIKEMPNITVITNTDSWIERMPALPISISNAVVIGRVTEAKAFLSSDETAVYSEFTVTVEEALKNNSNVLLDQGGTLTAEREGGRVQFASGHIQTYRTAGQGSPRINRRYVLFLKQNAETQDFLLLTAFELRKGRIVPVDQVSAHSVYKGYAEAEFLNKVRDEISNTPQGSSTEKGAVR